MATTETIAITLPAELVADIDRVERDRDRFVAEAVQHELTRRQKAALRQSLQKPHLETAELAQAGLADWAARLPTGDSGLVDPGGGKAVRWVEGQGWVEERG